MARIPIRRKIVYSALLLFAALIALEGALRLIGWYYLQRVQAPQDDGQKPTLLCLGDSFTYGIGAGVDENYPAHLARLLGHDWRVVNGGHPYMDSTSLLSFFSERLREEKPRIIVLLVGYNNYFRVESGQEQQPVVQTWLWRYFGKLKLVQLLHVIRVNSSIDQNVKVIAEIPRITDDELDRLFADPTYADAYAVFKRNGKDRNRVLVDPATDPDTLLAKGLAYLVAGEGRLAEPLFFEVLNQRPDDELALMGAGYITLYRREVLMGFVKEMFAPYQPWLAAGMATVLLDRGETADAESLMRETIKRTGWFTDGYLLLARIYLRLGDPAEALAMLEIVQAAEPWRAELQWLRGEALLAVQDWPEAKEAFNRAFKEGMDHPSYYSRLRRSLAALPQDPDALLRRDPAAYSLAPAAEVQRQYLAYARERLMSQPAARSSQNLTGDLAEMKRIADQHHVRLVLMSYPDRFQYDTLRDFAVQNDLLFVDNVPVYEQALAHTPPDRIFRPDGHCTGRGYLLMAENIKHTLEQAGLLAAGAQP